VRSRNSPRTEYLNVGFKYDANDPQYPPAKTHCEEKYYNPLPDPSPRQQPTTRLPCLSTLTLSQREHIRQCQPLILNKIKQPLKPIS